MRDEFEAGSGITYIGPRSFVAGFIGLCALFGAAGYGVPKVLDWWATPVPAAAPMPAERAGQPPSGTNALAGSSPGPSSYVESPAAPNSSAPAAASADVLNPAPSRPKTTGSLVTARHRAASGAIAVRASSSVVPHGTLPAKPRVTVTTAEVNVRSYRDSRGTAIAASSVTPPHTETNARNGAPHTGKPPAANHAIVARPSAARVTRMPRASIPHFKDAALTAPAPSARRDKSAMSSVAGTPARVVPAPIVVPLKAAAGFPSSSALDPNKAGSANLIVTPQSPR